MIVNVATKMVLEVPEGSRGKGPTAYRRGPPRRGEPAVAGGASGEHFWFQSKLSGQCVSVFEGRREPERRSSSRRNSPGAMRTISCGRSRWRTEPDQGGGGLPNGRASVLGGKGCPFSPRFGRSTRPCRPWHTRAFRTRVSARGLALALLIQYLRADPGPRNFTVARGTPGDDPAVNWVERPDGASDPNQQKRTSPCFGSCRDSVVIHRQEGAAPGRSTVCGDATIN